MANGSTHRTIAALVVGGLCLTQAPKGKNPTDKAILSGTLAAFFTNIPDLLEPAIHPHHRQFFHSITMAAFVGQIGAWAYEWKTEEAWQKPLRELILIGCGAYTIHLALDAFTPRSLPAIGKL